MAPVILLVTVTTVTAAAVAKTQISLFNLGFPSVSHFHLLYLDQMSIHPVFSAAGQSMCFWQVGNWRNYTSVFFWDPEDSKVSELCSWIANWVHFSASLATFFFKSDSSWMTYLQFIFSRLVSPSGEVHPQSRAICLLWSSLNHREVRRSPDLPKPANAVVFLYSNDRGPLPSGTLLYPEHAADECLLNLRLL